MSAGSRKQWGDIRSLVCPFGQTPWTWQLCCRRGMWWCEGCDCRLLTADDRIRRQMVLVCRMCVCWLGWLAGLGWLAACGSTAAQVQAANLTRPFLDSFRLLPPGDYF